jgi:hypothetical protein
MYFVESFIYYKNLNIISFVLWYENETDINKIFTTIFLQTFISLFIEFLFIYCRSYHKIH